jgi:hypothetical protein
LAKPGFVPFEVSEIAFVLVFDYCDVFLGDLGVFAGASCLSELKFRLCLFLWCALI